MSEYAKIQLLDERRMRSVFTLYENAVARACASAVQPDAAQLHRIAQWAEDAATIIHNAAKRSCVGEAVAR